MLDDTVVICPHPKEIHIRLPMSNVCQLCNTFQFLCPAISPRRNYLLISFPAIIDNGSSPVQKIEDTYSVVSEKRFGLPIAF